MQQGFSLIADPTLPPAAGLNWEMQLGAMSDTLLPVTWVPSETGPVSQLLHFKLDGRHRLQVGT